MCGEYVCMYVYMRASYSPYIHTYVHKTTTKITMERAAILTMAKGARARAAETARSHSLTHSLSHWRSP